MSPIEGGKPSAEMLREALQLGLEAAEELLNGTIVRYTSPDGTVRDFRGRITQARANMEKIEAALSSQQPQGGEK